MSLATNTCEWNRSSKSKSVTEFLTQIEKCPKESNWSDSDTVNTVKTKLTGETLQFFSGRDISIRENVTEILRTALIERFNDKLPNRYHYNLSLGPGFSENTYAHMQIHILRAFGCYCIF